MKRSYRFRLYPTRSQISILENMLSMCRYLYNWSLQERIEAYQNDKKTITYIDQQNQLPALKEARPWFKGVYSLVLQDVLHRLNNAYLTFFRQKKGFPKYRKKGQYTSICYTQHKTFPENNKIKIPKIGDISLRYHREIPKSAEIKTLTIIKEGSKWFCSFSLELLDLKEPKQEVKSAIGIDLGLENFVYCSNGKAYDALKAYKSYQKILKNCKENCRELKKEL